MIKDFYTAQEIAQVLDIYECSAVEMLAGGIEFEPDELIELAVAKGVSVGELLR